MLFRDVLFDENMLPCAQNVVDDKCSEFLPTEAPTVVHGINEQNQFLHAENEVQLSNSRDADTVSSTQEKEENDASKEVDQSQKLSRFCQVPKD